ncbi:uncharacterized protein [Zea mays]|uniref:Uncharacterized protein n=1 Tax=Zea mays TaxID=4577 RepID=A0A1D6KLA7_MAIZE|nr:uncharacterized protein LOC103643149 [Zea mays]ONM03674.1 hypothetical protein ZEAMMB73_Zm00001d031797 [Zea mays]|eukprot:XP_020402815.1 uncharacterized protein LOC103643149 [Zea mays]
MEPPRMSFSSDFALEPPPPRPPGRADADFEFSPAGSRPMMDADQLFSKGRILPLREAEAVAVAARPPTTTTTLRAELRARPDAADRGGRRAPPRWKELLGLRRAHRKGDAAGAGADAHVDLGEHGDQAEAGE